MKSNPIDSIIVILIMVFLVVIGTIVAKIFETIINSEKKVSRNSDNSDNHNSQTDSVIKYH